MSCIGNFEENMDLSHIYLAVQDAVFSTKYSGPNATSNDKHLSRGGTLSSPSNRVNSYDPDDGQLSLLKTPVGLPSSQELVDSKACLPSLDWLGLAQICSEFPC